MICFIGTDAKVVWRKKAFVLFRVMFLFAYESGLDSNLRFPNFYHTLEETANCTRFYSPNTLLIAFQGQMLLLIMQKTCQICTFPKPSQIPREVIIRFISKLSLF